MTLKKKNVFVTGKNSSEKQRRAETIGLTKTRYSPAKVAKVICLAKTLPLLTGLKLI